MPNAKKLMMPFSDNISIRNQMILSQHDNSSNSPYQPAILLELAIVRPINLSDLIREFNLIRNPSKNVHF